MHLNQRKNSSTVQRYLYPKAIHAASRSKQLLANKQHFGSALAVGLAGRYFDDAQGLLEDAAALSPPSQTTTVAHDAGPTAVLG